MSRMELVGYFGDIDEKLKENVSSEVLFKSIDVCLYKAIGSVIKTSFFVEELLSMMLTSSTKKTMYGVEKEQFDLLVSQFFNTRSIRKKIDFLIKMKINRDLVSYIIDMFLPLSKEIVKDVRGYKSTSRSLKNVKARHYNLTDHLIANEECKYWNSLYLDLRERICQKYYRHIVREIGKLPYNIKTRLDTEDVLTEFYLNLLRAFNRYDVSSGTFTSYVNNWLKFARSRSIELDEIGTAFTIPSSLRTKIALGESRVNNFSHAIDDDLLTDDRLRNFDSVIDKDTLLIIDTFDDNYLFRLLKGYEIDDNKMLKDVLNKRINNLVN